MTFSLANQGLQWSDAWFLLEGAGRSLQMAFASAVIGTPMGILLGRLRSVSLVVRVVTAPYIDILRSVPMLIQLILANSALSMLGFPTSTFWLASQHSACGCRRSPPRWCGLRWTRCPCPIARARGRWA